MRRTEDERAASAALVAAIGEAAFGPAWKLALAEAIGVTRLTVNRWAKGAMIPTEANLAAMRGLLADRQARIASVAKRLTRKGGARP
jgi:transcriptional regulator with XRE-family HTH domain